MIFNQLMCIDSIEEVQKCPVQPGVVVYFKDKKQDYIYTKSIDGDNISYKAYQMKEVDFESLLPMNKKLAEYATVEQVGELTSLMSQLTKEIAELKRANATHTYKPSKYYKKRRDEHDTSNANAKQN